MIVCLCKVVTDRAIERAVEAGARSVDDVARACGAGTGCGSCRPVVAEVVARACARQCDDCPRQAAAPFDEVAA
ncbi:MAG: (2Fe-2S)-binding protein [Deltaproteobacteria bacterium]|nr:MAG: (2Fe-2S)-binding protein [Deltaproteobacteria bacterium]